jgi:exodeoxyribonuclease-1
MSENSEFQDERLAELVFRYRARNFPASLSETDAQRWSEHCAMRFFDGAAGALTVDDFFAEIDQLSENAGEYEEGILGALYDYAEHIVPVR